MHRGAVPCLLRSRMSIPRPIVSYLRWLVWHRTRKYAPLPVTWMFRELAYRRLYRDIREKGRCWPGEKWLRKFTKDCVDCRRKYPEHPASMLIELQLLACWPKKRSTPEEKARREREVAKMLGGPPPKPNVYDADGNIINAQDN